MTTPTTTHYHAGSNDPGYLPDNPAECFDNLADAIAYLAAELRHDAETAATWCDGDDADDFHVDACPTCASVSALESTALWLEDVDSAELASGWGEVVAGRSYWLEPSDEECDQEEEFDAADYIVDAAALQVCGTCGERHLYLAGDAMASLPGYTCGQVDPPRRGSGPGAMLATKRTWNGSRRSLEDVTPAELATYRDGQKVAHNTFVEHDHDGSVGVRFHATRIITWHPDGSFTVNTGGWRTTTTKARLNALLPAGYQVYQVSYVWRIATPEGDFPFEDGDTWK